MKYKDSIGLPSALYNVLTGYKKQSYCDYSITQLISSPRVRELLKRYDDKIEVEAVSKLWAIFGNLFHSQMEKAGEINSLAEERLIANIFGVNVGGIPDLFENETIWDFKTGSVFSAKELKTEWEQQLNCYKFLLQRHGFTAKYLKICLICKDWSKTKAKHDKEYPQCPVVVMDVPVWDEMRIKDYFLDRITSHESAKSLSDNDLPECTNDERWMKGGNIAVMQKGKKRAIKLYDSDIMGIGLSSAEAHAKTLSGGYVEHRPAEPVKCIDYCDAAPFCNQYQKWLKERGE